MALLKTKELNTGFTIEFWEILSITFDAKKRTVRAVLGGYKDETAYDAGKEPAEIYPFEFQSSLDDFKTDFLSILYQKLQESRQEEKIVSEGREAVVDDNGVVIEEAVEPVVELEEKNPFADAVKID